MNFEPDWISSPGETIERLMVTTDVSKDDLSERLGLDSSSMEQLVRGELRITTSLAQTLADELGSTTRFWVTRDLEYLEERKRLERAHAVNDIAVWERAFPVASMRKLGWIPPRIRGEELQQRLLGFFGCESLSDWNATYSRGIGSVAFRTSFSFDDNQFATLAWLRAGEIQAGQIAVDEFDAEEVVRRIDDFRKLVFLKHPSVFWPKLQMLCSDLGIALVSSRAPEGCRASGASWCLRGRGPTIMLSFRHLSEDHFWFTFFHELAHVVLHGSEHISVVGGDPSPFVDKSIERQADEFAEAALIPADQRHGLVTIPLTMRGITAFSREVRTTLGITVGQLQKLGRLDHSKMNFLKRKYRWTESSLLPEIRQPRK